MISLQRERRPALLHRQAERRQLGAGLLQADRRSRSRATALSELFSS